MSDLLGFESLAPWMRALAWASLCGALLAVGVLAVQPLLGRWVPARWRFILWMVVMVRFIPLPLPESRWSLFGWIPRGGAGGVQRATGEAPGDGRGGPAAVAGPVSPADLNLKAGEGQNIMSEAVGIPALRESVPEVAGSPAVTNAAGTVQASDAGPALAPAAPVTAVPAHFAGSGVDWLALAYGSGMAIILARLVVSTINLSRLMKGARPVGDAQALAALAEARRIFRIRRELPLLACETMASPALVGAWRARLLVPRAVLDELSYDELRQIFLHECAHLRRRDVPLNYLMAAVSALHWFNPVVWLILPRIRAERELAADEAVLARTSDVAAYGHTLLKLVQSGLPPRAVVPAVVGIIENSDRQGKTFFARRIHMIARFRKPSAWVSVPLALGLAVLVACSFTAPASKGDTLEPSVDPVRADASKPPPTVNVPAPDARTATADAGNATTAAPASTPGNPDVLQDHVKVITADQQSLEKVLNFLRDSTNTNIIVNWGALGNAGVDRNTPVSVNLKEVPLRKVLQTVLDLAAGNSGTLGFEYDDGVITISSAADLAARNSPPAGNGPTADTMQLIQQALRESKAAAVSAATGVQDWIANDPNLRELKTTLLQLQQEEAALLASAKPNAEEGIKQLRARMEKVNDQIAEVSATLKAEADRRFKQLAASMPERQIHMFDVREIVGVPKNQETLNADERAAVDELVKTLARLLDGGDAVSSFNGMIIINAPPADVDKASGILDELRAREKQRRQDATKPGAMAPNRFPTYEGSDAAKIPTTDDHINQIVHLKYVNATRLARDLTPLLSADAQIAADDLKNTITITDTSGKIHRVAEIIAKLDVQMKVAYRQMKFSHAADAAEMINNLFSVSGGRRGDTSRGGGSLGPRVYADSDARTNTVVLNGPPDKLDQALATLQKLDEEAQGKQASGVQTQPSEK